MQACRTDDSNKWEKNFIYAAKRTGTKFPFVELLFLDQLVCIYWSIDHSGRLLASEWPDRVWFSGFFLS